MKVTKPETASTVQLAVLARISTRYVGTTPTAFVVASVTTDIGVLRPFEMTTVLSLNDSVCSRLVTVILILLLAEL